jgi:hypothetical protein
LNSEYAKPIRCAGARSESVVIISPLLPSANDITVRPARKSQTFGARMHSAPAITCATNERTMIGFREYRSASAPQSGSNGSPMALEIETIAPVQAATSSRAMPRCGRYNGVNALTCDQKNVSTRLAAV